MPPITRREFVRSAALAAAATQMVSPMRAAAATPAAAVPPAAPRKPLPEDAAELHWLDAAAPAAMTGATWGVPWPRGKHAKETAFALRTADGQPVPVQTWPLATWPDGTLKWTGHAIPADAPGAANYEIAPGAAAAPPRALRTGETAEAIEVDTGVVKCRIAKKGAVLVESITRGGREILRGGRLVCLRQASAEPAANGASVREEFVGAIDAVTLEQRGPVRAVVKIEGRHAIANGGRAWLPFVVRLYFYSGGEAVRVMHTFVFDGDAAKDFIAGLGLRFGVPMRDALYDRHVRFVGEGAGLWAEAVQGITGLRRDPGAAVREAQIAGQACPPLGEWDRRVTDRLKYVPVWGDFTLVQSSADGFEIRKRTKPGQGWIGAGCGRRAGGTGYIGGVSGGVAFGLRNFWQSHPAQLDVRGAGGDEAEVTMWLWSPEAPAMDLRAYHDDLGEDTYAKQLDALEITYEDYEPGFNTPHGIARTSELMLWALATTPARERTIELAAAVRAPAVIVCRPEYYHSIGLFGTCWGLPDRSTPAKAHIEDDLDFYFDFYRKQIEQRHWYGFWNFGDVRHTYDADRHVWRYDVGGFAWDNSELSPDLWLWYSFLRTGRPDVFRVAEAMTRHTGEVDVYHLGRFRGLGSRHNVQHWGDSAKQVRISTAVYRRFYYYLTADERVGDLMHELLDCDERVAAIPPGRKIGRAEGDKRW
ncbi:MAG TPA: Tat pathway signal sequence domain protein, partial [Opitutus sp.]|nr:Tat pathway signal sequence domain protein [Opitutus sp.]